MSETLGTVLWNAGRRHGARPAIARGTEVRTYAQLLDRAGRLAHALAAHGVLPHDRVASFVDDRVESVEVFVACALGGFTLVPVNARFRSAEAAHVIRDSGAAALVYTTSLSGEVVAIDGLDELRAIVAIGAGDRAPASAAYEDLLAAAAPATGPRVVGPEDIAIIGYTSGTTGFPKGALVSHRAAVLATRLVPHVQGMVGRGACTFVGSFSFVSALWGILYPHLWTGSLLRIMEPGDTDAWIDAMRRDGATYTWVPSPLVRSFRDAIAAEPDVLARLCTVVHTGSKVPAEFLASLADVVGDRLVETWGLTETVGPLSATTRADFGPGCRARDLFGSVGRTVPTAQVAVLASDGTVRDDPDVTGELVARADTLFSGYLHRPDDDPATFHDGWFRTGDVGHIDEAGYITIDDRCKDVIVSGGMNVYPAEIELVLATMPGIVECAVIGVPDDRWGETVAAIVVRASGSGIDADAVTDHVRQRLAGYKKPTRVHFVEALPRNASMKVQKAELRERFRSDTGR